MLTDVEILGHTSTMGKPAKLDVAADPSASLSHQPGGFSHQTPQPTGVTPSQTPGATLTGSKATMHTPSFAVSSIQGSVGQLEGQPYLQVTQENMCSSMFKRSCFFFNAVIQILMLCIPASSVNGKHVCLTLIFMQNLSPCLL